MVSEWMYHGTLKAYLERHPRAVRQDFVRGVQVDAQQIVDSDRFQICQIIDGLNHMHSLNFVHSDLKAVSAPGMIGGSH